MSAMSDQPPEDPVDRGDFGHPLAERLQYPPMFQPPPKSPSMARRFLVVTLGLLGIVLAIMGLEWADLHEPSLANALAGRQLYSDAGTIRVLSAILLVACIALLVWEFVWKRRPRHRAD